MQAQWPQFDEAAHARRTGDLKASSALCRARLEAVPDDAAADALLAANEADTGALDQALGRIDRALDHAPDHAMVQLYASGVFEAAGRAEAALQAAQAAAQLAPHDVFAQGRLGDLAGRLGDMEVAFGALERACSLAPDVAFLQLRRAGAALATGRYEAASEALARLDPGTRRVPDALRIETALAHRRADWAAMSAAAEEVLRQDPGDDDMAGALAHALGQQGHYNRATRLFRPIAERRGDADSYAALGRLRLGARDLPDARAAFEKALLLDPGHAEAHYGMARLLTFTGDLDGAAEACRAALASDPDHLEAYGQLGEASGGALSDEEIERLQRLVEEPEVDDARRAIGYFALGDAHHRRKERAAAFTAWSKANDVRVSRRSALRPGYDPDAQSARRDQLQSLFPGPVKTDGDLPGDAPTPIFITGMPRSGTTLLEAVFAAHSEVAAGGELPVLPLILDEMLSWAEQSRWRGGALPADKLAGWRERYIAQYSTFATVSGERFVTDKQPSNIFAVGLIAQLFPNAPILHIRRNPVETGFSIFRRNFSQQWPFADRLEDIAHYYAEHSRIAEHWSRAFPGRVGLVQYETLIDDFEAGVRRALALCKLPYERECLRFYEVDRAVMTFSAAQVRKPPSADHKSVAEPYRDHLGPLRAALAEQGVDLDSGALAQGADGTGSGLAPKPEAPGWLERLGLKR